MGPGRTRRLLYRSFRLVYAIEDWIARRFTMAGRLVLAGFAAAAVVGVDTNRTVAYQAFAFLAAVLGIALASGLSFRARFAVERRLPRYGTAGEPLPYRLVVHNQTGRIQSGLLLGERLADPRPTIGELADAREPGEERRNWFDRTVGYPRWAWLVRQNQRADPAALPVPAITPRGRVELSPFIVPRRRGPLRFTAVDIARPDPLGLFKACVTVPAPASVLVLPRRYPVPHLDLPGRRRYQRGGVSLTTSVGDSEEFAALRDYRPGDPLRRVHWRSFARFGKPVVKEYQDEFFIRHALVLDTFATGGSPVSPERFEDAVSVAASFACAIETQESLLDLLFVGPEAHAFTAGRGVAQTARLLEVLAGVRPCTAHPFEALHRLAVERQGSLSGAVCVLLAWDHERRMLVRDLRARGLPTLTLVIGDARATGTASMPDADEGDVHLLPVGGIAEGLSRL